MQFWDKSKPEVTQEDRLKGVVHAHPLGDRRTFLFVSMVKEVCELTSLQGSQYLAAWKELAQMDMDLVTGCVGHFGPRFPSPKGGRPWAMELHLAVLATDAFKDHF